MKKVDKTLQKKVFTALKIIAYGKENGVSADCAAAGLAAYTTRELRYITSAINSNTEIDGLISTNGSIYVCATEEECRKAISNTYKTAFSYLKKARIMEKKCNLQGQYEFTDENGKKIKIIYEE